MGMLCPSFEFEKITEIDFKIIVGLKIKLILIDIDNTLTEHGKGIVDSKVKDWLDYIKSFNIKIMLVSNNNRRRVEAFADNLGLEFIWDAGKPLPFKVSKKVKKHFKKEEILLIGDQVFTDILFANLMGIKSVLLEPISIDEPKQIKLKRVFEKPFRKIKRKEDVNEKDFNCDGSKLKYDRNSRKECVWRGRFRKNK